jgi:hypothetical protein
MSELPERPAEGAEGGEKLSKKALKKLEKEKEKVSQSGILESTQPILGILRFEWRRS